MMLGRRVVLLGCSMVALLFGVPARAQPAGDPRAAEALFSEAQALMERGDYTNACPKLEESYRLDKATGALFALALCHEAEGRNASAWVEFLEVAARASTEGNSEREREARERGQAIREKLSFLTVRVVAATAKLPALVVTRNGVRLGPAAWGSPIPVDRGRHEVTATAPGYETFRGVVEIGAAPQRATVVVPVLPPRKEPNPASSGMTFTPLRIAGVGFGAAAVASLGVATYASLRALDKYADSEGDCPDNVCNVAGDRARTSAEEAAHLATVSAAAGAVFLVTGAILFVLGSPGATPQASAKISASAQGLRLEF